MKLCVLATLSTAYESMPADLVERKTAEAARAAEILRRSTGDDVLLLATVGMLDQLRWRLTQCRSVASYRGHHEGRHER